MLLTPAVRKLLLMVHVTASVGWIGALAVFLALALLSVLSQEHTVVSAAGIAMGAAAWLVILPLSLTAFASGVVQALGTPWGLVRNYWVVFKLLLTALATTVLVMKLAPIRYLADTSAQTTLRGDDLAGVRMSVLIHAGAGLLVLLANAALAIFKPQAVTGFGAPELSQPAATPLWVKVFAVAVGGLLMMTLLMMCTGRHGPGADMMHG